MIRIASLVAELTAAHPPLAELWLELAGTVVRIGSSSVELCAELTRYFGDAAVSPRPSADVDIGVIEMPPPRFPLELRDWPREAGKRGKKERYADASDGRLVVKVRTGMQFLLTPQARVAVGPCSRNLNQVVNFIIAQYLARRLGEGWLSCHASAVALGAEGLAIAAQAGSGKSTLALHLMSTGLSFVSNDRLLIRRDDGRCELLGVPKMPRVNPGTLLHNRDLVGLLPAARRAELEALPARELWQLEEKHDVMVSEVFGRGRTRDRVPLRALIVLGWSLDGVTPTRFDRVDLSARPDLLERIMKSPGVFHQELDGGHASAEALLEPEAYLRALRDVVVYEATGKADFDVGVGFCRRLLED